jgi:hypothetical protein
MKILHKLFGHKCKFKFKEIIDTGKDPKCVYCGKLLSESLKEKGIVS